MVRIFASRLGRMFLGIWVIMLITSVSGLNLVPTASKNPNPGSTSSGATTSSKPSKPSKSCTANAPTVVVENNWAWGSPGSWGLQGQQLGYQVQVTNNDVGCGPSSFVISMSAPDGFSVSVPTNTISLKSTSQGFLWAYVTSPGVIADGDYPLIATVERAAASTPDATFTSYYKVYSADTTAPTLFFSNPWDGATISGSSYDVVVSSSDDHAVSSIDLFIDNAYATTATCDDVTYICHLGYNWSLHGVSGQHTVTFASYDWMGNVGLLTVTFTVG
jgi:Big-like domain-containing protein